MAGNNFTFVDNSTQILKKTVKSFDRSAKQLRTDLRNAVQMKILYGYKDPHGPDRHTEIVDTGRLFDSIDAEVKRVSQNAVDIRVGSNDVPYAVWVHNGTRKLKARHFITDAVQESQNHIRDVLTDELKNA